MWEMKQNLQEKQEKRNKYKSELDNQLQEKKFSKISLEIQKKQDLLEAQRKTKQEEKYTLSEKIFENDNKRKLKELYEKNSELSKQRKATEKEKTLNEERQHLDYIDIIQGRTRLLEKKRRLHGSVEYILSPNRHSDVPLPKSKKFFDMNVEKDKREFFKSVTEQQLKIENYYLNNIHKKETEKDKLYINWVEKGIHENLKKHDQRLEQEKLEKNKMKTEVKKNLDKQVLYNFSQRQKQESEDRAFNFYRNSLLQKDLQEQLKRQEVKVFMKELYAKDLMNQMKNYDIGTKPINPNKISTTPKISIARENRISIIDTPNRSEFKNAKNESQIYRKPSEPFAGAFFAQSPTVEPNSPTYRRAAQYKMSANSRPFENILK